MDYENTPISQNIEDRRGQGGGGFAMGGGGLGIVGIIAVLAISYFTGINPAVLMGGAEMVSRHVNQGADPARLDRAGGRSHYHVEFLSHVLGSTEGVWLPCCRSRRA
jgi:predicted metalloprotease